MPLAQRSSDGQAKPGAVLQASIALLPSQAFMPLQAVSVCPIGVLEQVPREPGTLQAWQVPLQSVSQQTPSTHLPLAQAPAEPHTSPLHALQSPPQSMPVSVPFFVLSEQLRQVCVAMSQEALSPVQSAVFRQPTHIPMLSQTPGFTSHGAPVGTPTCGTPWGEQASWVQGLPSSVGVLVVSTSSSQRESLQTFFMQLPGTVLQSSLSMQATGPVLLEVAVVVEVDVVIELDVETIVDVVVVVDEPPPPPFPARPAVFSVQPPGATMAAPTSARVMARPMVGDRRADEKRKLLQEAMGSP